MISLNKLNFCKVEVFQISWQTIHESFMKILLYVHERNSLKHKVKDKNDTKITKKNIKILNKNPKKMINYMSSMKVVVP